LEGYCKQQATEVNGEKESNLSTEDGWR